VLIHLVSAAFLDRTAVYVGKFKALLSPVLLIGSVMTLFEPDLLKPFSRLLLQYDTWEIMSCGVLQNISSRLPRTKSFQAEFWASEFDGKI
jgi:hypothetical protein